MLILPFIFAFSAGLFDAMMDLRQFRTRSEYNLIWLYIQEHNLEEWYVGGKQYPSKLPFNCDHWHWAKWTVEYLHLAVVFSVIFYTQLNGVSYYTFSFLLLPATKGLGHGFSYNYLFQSNVTFREFVGGMFIEQ